MDNKPVSAMATGTTTLDKKQTRLLPGLIGALVALAIVCVIVWINRGTPDSYNPPPAKPVSSADIQTSIERTKNDPSLSAERKKGIIAMMQGKLEEAKQREAKTK